MGQGERIPVFEEVLDAVSSPLQAEIKDVAAARALAEVILERDLVGRVEVSSTTRPWWRSPGWYRGCGRS
ncbi:hypothetical protein SCYAM73S_02867 [Streptomyces cyaneofuscatus]